MAKKTKKYEKKESADKPDSNESSKASTEKAAIEKLPKEVQEKLKSIKTKLDRFQKKLLGKFDKYIMGMTLLPPPKADQKQTAVQGQSDRLLLFLYLLSLARP